MTNDQATAAGDDFKHPKCYANVHGGCSTRISGEHYVSHGLIRLYGENDPAFTLQHKTGKGVGHPVTAKNFKANILCQKHNSALSPADDAALAFATFLRRTALEYDAGAGEWGAEEEVTISGEDFRRWVLKIFLNHAVTKHFEEQQDRTVTFPDMAIDLLLDRVPWPPMWGIAVPGASRSGMFRALPYQPVDVVNSHWWGVRPFVHKSGAWMGGALVDLAHMSFGMTLYDDGGWQPPGTFPDDPKNPIGGSLQQPANIAWSLHGVEKRVNFTWDNPLHTYGLVYRLRPQNKAARLAGQPPAGVQHWLD
ncbi:hypothetical protein O6072_02450 [Mycolicibacterium neoaurum]|uniref:hypothetical protein n=1 Tax=Mycolicibacterium neoaurum TaxID=1795 RepID=UPI00248C3453|nr:hypothetical protein [Mycolicibacterium neoaurum]WBP94940.1 hypothetical protein O7W24_01665 [Mycolicibacterium neoaurum]WBS08761.1 hypothetical protein O6072_02450 [Mycolicibacterium neoaurum]